MKKGITYTESIALFKLCHTLKNTVLNLENQIALVLVAVLPLPFMKWRNLQKILQQILLRNVSLESCTFCKELWPGMMLQFFNKLFVFLSIN